MAISIIFSSMHNNYDHYQQNTAPENYKIQVLLRTEGFFRQRKKSLGTADGDGSWRRRARGAYIQVIFYGTCIGTLPNWRLVAGCGNRQVKLRAGSNVLLHLGGLSLLWTTAIIIRPQLNRGTKRTETGLYQNKKGTAPIQLFTPGTNEDPWNSHSTGYFQGASHMAGANHFSRT